MAELAAGAVSSLLVVIRSEALLLRGVRDDVQFIKEEMESMKSFLAHLARWATPGGEHDEQVRTWMNQVRLLAQDCNNCIDLYLYRGNPDIHRARGGLRGYLWWATWFLHKLVAQHRAAEQLALLKERARDVGERRLRYGVEVPDKSGKGQSPPTTSSSSSRAAAAGGYAAGEEEEEEEEEQDGDDQLVGVMVARGHSAQRTFTEPRIVGDPVHGFITTIARKQHIVETCLSHHLARHFSIFNDLQLRSSDKIDKFFQGLSKSSQVSLLKVLDLEGCRCFLGKNQRYLKDICSKMLLLKYLSLRRTDIAQLPGEINNLRELEVLDIRETKVPPHAIANILLLKLKRLLAGYIDLNSSNFGSSGWIPHRIDKMVNMEVLSNVKAQQSHDLIDIGKLWQLRKLGVVIDDKDSHLKNLLETISDLHECLRSLSITAIPVATPWEGTPSSAEFPDGIGSLLKNCPKILESLSIRGTTQKGRLLPLFIKSDRNKLAKVTLCHTLLSQDDLKVLAKLPKLRCVRLQHIVCTEHMLNFKDGEFRCLKYLVVEGSDLTNITFEAGAASELEKMVLSITSICSISGVDQLLKLKEFELNSSFCGSLLSSFDNAKQIAKLTLHGTLLEQDALQLLTKKRNIRSLVLLEKSFGGAQNEITLKKDEFLWLNLLEVHCSAITKIVFTCGSAPRLEKIVWSSSTSLSGMDELPRLKELEFRGDQVPVEVSEAIKNHKNKPSLKLNGPETQD